MTMIEYPQFAQKRPAFSIGQAVQAYYRGGIGQRDNRPTLKVTKITATQITLDNGDRFTIATGLKVGTFVRCETRPSIIKVEVV